MTPERFQKLKEVLARRQPDLTVFAADVHKPHNISAILRTCDAVGIHRMHAVSPDGEFRRHHMAAGGSARWVEVCVHDSFGEAVDAFHGKGWQIAAAHPSIDGMDYREIDYTRKLAILVGSELDGLGPEAVEAADMTIALPMEGMGTSLNVSVAAAIILYEARRQRRAAGMYERSRLGPDELERVLFEWAQPEIAKRCRDRGEAYPELTDEGSLKTNPFAARR